MAYSFVVLQKYFQLIDSVTYFWYIIMRNLTLTNDDIARLREKKPKKLDAPQEAIFGP